MTERIEIEQLQDDRRMLALCEKDRKEMADLIERLTVTINGLYGVIDLAWLETSKGVSPMTDDVRAAFERAIAARPVLASLHAESAEIERLTMLHANAKHWEAQWLAEIEGLRALLFRLRNYIAGERTLDRPKDAMLELIDAALERARRHDRYY